MYEDMSFVSNERDQPRIMDSGDSISVLLHYQLSNRL